MPRRLIRIALALIVAAGLAVDAYVHLHLASSYALVRTSTVSQATLFRLEGIAAILAAAAVLVRPNRVTASVAFIVGAAGAAAVLIYTNTDPGRIGPFPDMYEPVWYTDKSNSLIGEVIAAAAAVLLFVVPSGKRASRATPRLTHVDIS